MRKLTVEDRQKVLHEAMSWLGSPYKLRGMTKNGVDCSQFVMAVYRNALGINLISNSNQPFLASWLFLALEVIHPGKLQPGDLVFYCRRPRPNARAVTSVAIYIGDNKVIHAGLRLRKVAIEPIHDYPGSLILFKDHKVIEAWLAEVKEEFPNLQ